MTIGGVTRSEGSLKKRMRNDRFATFEVADGTRIRYAFWQPEGPPRGAVVLLHGRTEFLEKYFETIDELLARGFAVWSKDWRGQGLSSRPLSNARKGHADSFDPLLEDLHVFLTEIVRPSSPGPHIALAHSMGGHLALRYMADRPGFFAKAVLSAPMVDIHTGGMPRPFAEQLARLTVQCGLGRQYLVGMGDADPYAAAFKDNLLTSDPVRFQRSRALTQANPALGLGGPTFAWVHAAYQSIRKLENPDYVRRIDVPVLCLSAAEEQIVRNDAQIRLCHHLPQATFVSFPEARHELLFERDPIRARFWETFDKFTDSI